MNPDTNAQPVPQAVPEQPGMTPAPTQPLPPMPAENPVPTEAAQPSEESQPMFAAPPSPMAPEAPQPMFTPMGDGQAQNMPGMPMQPMGAQPSFNPMSASQMGMPKAGKKKLVIIIVAVLVALGAIGGGLAVFVLGRTELIGTLTNDSYQSLKYKRPASWDKDTSITNVVSYRPKISTGKASGGDKLYALNMAVRATKDIFGSAPDALSASDKQALSSAIDKAVSKASTEILPNKYDIGCSDTPAFINSPKKITIPDSFMAITYSFTCTNANATAASKTLYYVVDDIVPNNQDVEYLMTVGSASEAVYKTNKSKIDQILSSVSF